MLKIKTIVREVWKKIVQTWRLADGVARGKAVEITEYETEEMGHVFSIIVLGSFIGLPSPPMQISLDLMPLMEKDLILMMEKVDTAHEPISDLFSVLDID
ncbi:MAG: hypothetical protein ACQEQO_10640 [Thermodesulfobacteriota bacterium]